MSTILYMAAASPPARAVMMMIDILGLDIDQRELNPILREQDVPELKKKNPMRTIPFLDEGDYSLADSHAILIYLMEKYAEPQHSYLYPNDIRKRGTIHQRLFFDCGILFQRLRAIMAPTYTGKLTEIASYMRRNVEDEYSTLEAYLAETKYMADDVVTIADISIVSTMGSLNGLHPVDESRYPKLKVWLTNMNKEDVCQKINIPGSEIHVAGLKFLMVQNGLSKKSKL